MAQGVHADLVDFEGLLHGEIVSTQVPGVTVSAVNYNQPFDLAVAFDTEVPGTSDADLEFPWDGGNLAPDTFLGNILIIAENDLDADGDGYLDDPDDEGGQPAGQLIFVFDDLLTEFGLDLIDIEPAEGGYLEFFEDGDLLTTVTFAEFTTPLSDFYDPTVEFGDNTANRISPLSFTVEGNGGLVAFDEVRVNLGGSGGVDNLYFTFVPAPGAGVMLLGLFAGRRRRRA
jgi:hypothetical protein